MDAPSDTDRIVSSLNDIFYTITSEEVFVRIAIALEQRNELLREFRAMSAPAADTRAVSGMDDISNLPGREVFMPTVDALAQGTRTTREPWHIDDTSEQRGQTTSRTFINVQDLFERAEEFEIATLNWVRIILRDSNKERTLTGSQAKGFIDWVRFHTELIPDEMYAALKREAVPVEVAPPKPKIWTCTACGAIVEPDWVDFRWTGVWQHRCGMDGTPEEWANCQPEIDQGAMDRARAAMSNVPTEAIDSLVDELKKRGGE